MNGDVEQDRKAAAVGRALDDEATPVDEAEAAAEAQTVEDEAQPEPAEQAEEAEEERLVPPATVKDGGRITEDAVRYVGQRTDKFFGDERVVGKMKVYRELAGELGLGLETIARIARCDIYPEVE